MCACKLFVSLNRAEGIREVSDGGWWTARAHVLPGCLARGSPALSAPWSDSQRLLRFRSSKLTATQLPGGAGEHVGEKQALSPNCREWESLCLGYKCGGTRLINLAASREECQCLLMRPQMSFHGTQRPPAAQMGWVTLDCRAGDAQGELCCVKAMLREREK